MTITSFDTLEDVFSAMEADLKVANANVEEWQSKLVPGDFFIRFVDGIPIFCRVLDPALPVYPDSTLNSDELAELKEEALWYAEPHMQSFRFCYTYSQFCPEGELGDVHVSTASLKIHSNDFLAAKELGWKLQ